MSARDVTVSVVVPAWNAGQTIGTTVSALLMQTAAPDEIIIVDDGSTDETIEALAGFGDAIKVIRRPNGGPSAARNTGVREATSDLIAFT
ncbi:MAG: putative glycosyltransferase EpsJ, partial [Acidobacteriota bacterium]